MRKYKFWIIPAFSIVIFGVFVQIYLSNRITKDEWKLIKPIEDKFSISIPASGTVDPQNRIVITSPVSGRMDKILVKEGDSVKKGQVIAWLSSTDRAALLDMAQTQSADVRARWEKEYLPTPIISPSSGLVIMKNTVPGQTVTQQSSLFEISDKLIVRAEVDETDIAKIQVGQSAKIQIDAFPETDFKGKVLSIAHQSKLSNSVNIYEVLVEFSQANDLLRSGMTSTVHFAILDKEKAILAPSWIAAGNENSAIDIFVKNKSGDPEKRAIKVGISDGKRIEILDGINLGEEIMYLPVRFLQEAKSPFAIFRK